MSIKIKRDTGMMGGASKVALEVNQAVVKKLKNNEEYIISSKDDVLIKAKQGFFGSEKKKVNPGDMVEIKINNAALLLFVVSLLAMFFGTQINPVVTLLGLVGGLVTVIYSTRKWFILEVK